MNQSYSEDNQKAVKAAVTYLRSCGIRVPRLMVTTEPRHDKRYGGSYAEVDEKGSLRLNLGRYMDPTPFTRTWFAMHQLGHVLWIVHQPLRWKNFRAEFGEPCPPDFDGMSGRECWKTSSAWKLSWFPGPHRPAGQPSWYGARGGGEERFCELIGLMWAHGDFSKEPPADLADLWNTCWNHGLSRMI